MAVASSDSGRVSDARGRLSVSVGISFLKSWTRPRVIGGVGFDDWRSTWAVAIPRGPPST